MIVIAGMVGLGKTTLATIYFERTGHSRLLRKREG
jgi:deoxyadenosine/deoxycytidine kinase